MISRRESRDRRVVLAALTSVGPSAITLLGLYSLTALPEARVAAALAHLQAEGLVDGWREPGGGLPGPRRTRYRLAPTPTAPARRHVHPAPAAAPGGGALPGQGRRGRGV
jgi:hypothetical protein